MRYLGITPRRLSIGVFELTSCEGCELQLANKEDTLVDFLRAADIVAFREISSAPPGRFEVALVEGAVTRDDEVPRLQAIREQARLVVALGSCACFGGVNRLKDAAPAAARDAVYGGTPVPSGPVRPLHDVVPVDLELPGCPVAKEEVERVLRHLVLDVPFDPPVYPVCVECKQRFVTCTFETGQLCLGSVTRAGCGAPCPAGGLGCWGCRGPAAEASLDAFRAACLALGYGRHEVDERLAFYGGFGVRP